MATRESDLASLQAKKRRLADLTALSTITVVLLDPEAAGRRRTTTRPASWPACSGGWDALLASLAVLLTVLGALLPWLIALGLPVWAIFLLVRRFAPAAAAAAAPRRPARRRRLTAAGADPPARRPRRRASRGADPARGRRPAAVAAAQKAPVARAARAVWTMTRTP